MNETDGQGDQGKDDFRGGPYAYTEKTPEAFWWDSGLEILFLLLLIIQMPLKPAVLFSCGE